MIEEFLTRTRIVVMSTLREHSELAVQYRLPFVYKPFARNELLDAIDRAPKPR